MCFLLTKSTMTAILPSRISRIPLMNRYRLASHTFATVGAKSDSSFDKNQSKKLKNKKR